MNLARTILRGIISGIVAVFFDSYTAAIVSDLLKTAGRDGTGQALDFVMKAFACLLASYVATFRRIFPIAA